MFFFKKTKIIYQIKALDEMNMVVGFIYIICRRNKKLLQFYMKINEKNQVFSKIFFKTPTHPIKKLYQIKALDELSMFWGLFL